VPALRYRAKPMTKGFTTEGGMRFGFPPYALKIIYNSSSWAFGPPVKHEKLYAPSPQPSPPLGERE
jgi:hypothetical protein